MRPLPPRRPRGGHHGDVVLRRCPGREGVHGQLLVVHVVHERPRRGARDLVHEPLGGLEQSDDGVQVPVRPHGLRSPGQGTTPPARCDPGRVPQGPQHGFSGGAGLVQRLLTGLEHVSDARRGIRVHLRELEQHTVRERLDEEVVARASTPRTQLVTAQFLADPAHLHGGRPADPRRQQGHRGTGREHGSVGGPLTVCVLGLRAFHRRSGSGIGIVARLPTPARAGLLCFLIKCSVRFRDRILRREQQAQGMQQRDHRGFLPQGGLGGGRGRGHAQRRQLPGQRRQLGTAAHDHRHVPVGHTVQNMQAQEVVRAPARLGRGRIEERRAHRTRRCGVVGRVGVVGGMEVVGCVGIGCLGGDVLGRTGLLGSPLDPGPRHDRDGPRHALPRLVDPQRHAVTRA